MATFTASSDTTDGLTHGNDTNTTGEGSTDPPPSQTVVLYQTPVLLLMSVFGTSANVLVILAIIRNKKLRRPANYYILSAAVNDGLCCLIVDNGLNVLYTYLMWPLGNVACLIWTVCDYGTSISSIYHITLLAWDRYEAIVTPYTYSSPRKIIRLAVSISLTYAFSFGLVLTYGLTVVQFDSSGYCYFNSQFYWVVTVVDIVPFISVPFFYTGCLIAMQRQFKRLHPAGVSMIAQSQRTQPVTMWKQVTSALRNFSFFDCLRQTTSSSRSRHTDSSDPLPSTSAAPVTEVVTAAVSEEARNPPEVKLPSTKKSNVNGQSSRTTQSNPIPQPQTDATAAYRRHQKHYRNLRTLTILIVSYWLFWGPILCCQLYNLIHFNDWNATCTTPAGDGFIYLGVYFQQAINPILVIAAQSQFRHAVWSLFRCRGEQQ